MGATLKEHTELNAVQISLLRLFNRPMSEKEILEIRNLLVDHYSEMLKEEVTKAIEKKLKEMEFPKVNVISLDNFKKIID